MRTNVTPTITAIISTSIPPSQQYHAQSRRNISPSLLTRDNPKGRSARAYTYQQVTLLINKPTHTAGDGRHTVQERQGAYIIMEFDLHPVVSVLEVEDAVIRSIIWREKPVVERVRRSEVLHLRRMINKTRHCHAPQPWTHSFVDPAEAAEFESVRIQHNL
jgi:hypothetical protein